MASREGSGAGEGSGEARAARSVLSGSAFRTAASARAETASGAVAQRWAPDGAGAERAPAMRALRFADRHLTAYLGSGHPMRGRRVDRAVPSVNWLFPIPWFGDELDWMSAARAATNESVRAAWRSGEMTVAAPRPAARAERAGAGGAVGAAASGAAADRTVGFGLPVELVAPSFAAQARGGAAGVAGAAMSRAAGSGVAGGRQAGGAWRAYTPMVDGAAARAAEFLSELAFRTRSEEGQPGGWRPAPLLALVTPTELAGGGRDAAVAAQLAEAARRELEQRRAAAVRRAAQAASGAPGAARSGAAAAPGGMSSGPAAGVASSAAADAARAAGGQMSGRATGADAASGDGGGARAGDEARAVRAAAAAGQGTAGFAASGDVRALSGATGAAGAGSIAGAAGWDASASERALELLAEGLASGSPQRMSPAAGPRVLMPAGLGGFLAASSAARAVERPAGRAAGGAPIGGAPVGHVGGTRPAALDHVLWADRWLARFAGASPAALRSFAAAGSMTSSSALLVPGERWRGADWSPAWVAPADGGAAGGPSSVAGGSGASGAARSAAAGRSGVVVNEDEPVSDDVFGAIAAAASAERARVSDRARMRAAAGAARAAAGRGAASGRTLAPAAPTGPVAPVGPFRTPLADRALGGFALGGSPGLAAGLAASPLASILAGLLDLAPQTAFDARPLSLAALGEFFSRGAVAARWSSFGARGDESGQEPAGGAATMRRLAGSAPDSVWLSLQESGAERATMRGARGPFATAGGAAGPGSGASGATAFSQAGVPAAAGGAAGAAVGDTAATAGPMASMSGPMAAWMAAQAGFLAGPLAGHVAGAPVESAGLIPGSSLGARIPGEAPRPGDVATRAESFADARTVAASDLALDFLSPELLAAARAAGMGPIEAGRAQRLAASGRPYLMALAMAVDRVFVEALSPGRAIEAHALAGSAARGVAHPGAAAGQAASAQGGAPDRAFATERGVALPAATATATALERAAPTRVPRGAFLLPDAAARALGVPATSAESQRPSFAAALDLVAASHVAEAAAAWRPGTGDGLAAAVSAGSADAARALASGASAIEGAGIGAAQPADAAQAARLDAAGLDAAGLDAAQAARAGTAQSGRGEAARSASTQGDAAWAPAGAADAGWSSQVHAARAQLPRELWPIFDAVYVSLGESPETRPLAPSARAARALALASRSAAAASSGNAGLSARARAAAAWAVLPVLLPGGAGPAARSASSPGGTATGARSSAVARAGDALGALVAPSILVTDSPADRGAAAWRDSGGASWSARVEAPFIETGAASRPAPPPPAPPPPPPRPPERQVSEADMAWFQEAARKYLGEAGPASGGISVAEMTLVTAAPRTQIAASPVSAGRAVTQASSTTPTGGDGGKQDGLAVPGRPDVDKIAQEVFEQICRMMAVARERSGDPWQR